MNFKNKKIIILGSQGLIGQKLCEVLTDHDCNLILVDQYPEPIIKKHLRNFKYRTVDVTSSSQVSKLIEEEDRVDGLVNLSYPRNERYGRAVFDVESKDFNENVSMMLGSSFAILKALALKFTKDKHPISIVNIASVYGVIAPKFEIYDNCNFSMPVEYSASKAAIIHLTKYFAKYVRSHSFRVNVLSPGGVFDNHEENFVNGYGSNTFSGKMLNRDEIIGSILFLLSDLSFGVNGQNLIVDDGFTL